MKTTISHNVRKRHPHAKIINLSGHRLPDSVIERIKELHESYSIYSCSVHVDIDEDLFEQCTVIMDNILTQPDVFGANIRECDGELYYVGPGHSQTNLIIYEALEALFGYCPHLISIGVNKYRFQSYDLKRCYALQEWKGHWRSIERNRYLLK